MVHCQAFLLHRMMNLKDKRMMKDFLYVAKMNCRLQTMKTGRLLITDTQLVVFFVYRASSVTSHLITIRHVSVRQKLGQWWHERLDRVMLVMCECWHAMVHCQTFSATSNDDFERLRQRSDVSVWWTSLFLWLKCTVVSNLRSMKTGCLLVTDRQLVFVIFCLPSLKCNKSLNNSTSRITEAKAWTVMLRKTLFVWQQLMFYCLMDICVNNHYIISYYCCLPTVPHGYIFCAQSLLEQYVNISRRQKLHYGDFC